MPEANPRRYRARAAVRSASLLALVAAWSAYAYATGGDHGGGGRGGSRALEEGGDDPPHPCPDVRRADPPWLCAVYLVGVLYMFVAIAIVCDELFVPTLEEMSSDRHLNLSMDVAGATLMAAGGSAPELFTNLFGTFVTKSEVGIGTVVGSAVFNVLFVIAMCALWSREVLELTWWPLFRDSLYYGVGLVVLGVFVGVVSPGEIQIWEAVVLFLMYIGYVVVMALNGRIYKRLTGRELSEEETDEGSAGGEDEFQPEPEPEPEPEPRDPEEGTQRETAPARGAAGSAPPPRQLAGASAPSPSTRSLVSVTSAASASKWPGTFRTGVLKLLRDPDSWVRTAGVGIVAQIAGDVGHVFREVDVDGNGEIDKEELARLFEKLDCNATAEELDAIMRELDDDGDGKISERDFTVWYIRSEERIKSRVRTVFNHFDVDRSGTIDRDKVRRLLEALEPSTTDDDVDEAMAAMYQNGSRDEITYHEFSHWYIHSMVYGRQTKKVEEEMEGVLWESLKPPSGQDANCMAYAKYIIVLPIVAILAFTVPDVRRPGWHRFCYLSFVLSILWIGLFSYFMVNWAEIIGNTIGIPSVIMGLTLLAAGTSVPDLLSSVIVARMGEGDMALSSSIGSNIFDILVGLPLPWIIYTAWNSTVITIGSKNVWVYIFTLLGMLVFVVAATHCQGWRLTRTLAVLMLVFYFGFLAMAIVLELPFEICHGT